MAAVRGYLGELGGLDGAEIDDVAAKSIARALEAWIPGKGVFATFAVACAKKDVKSHFRTRARARQQQPEHPRSAEASQIGRVPDRRYSSLEDLWPAVRALCLAAFEHTHGRPWEERFAAIEVPVAEELARDAFQKLRAAARGVVDVVNDYSAAVAGPCWQYLDWLREQQPLMFFHMCNSVPEPWPPMGRTPADRRARIAWVWTHASPLQSATASTASFGMLNGTLQYSVSSENPRLSNQDLAVVSLLSGTKSNVRLGRDGLTVTAVLALEAENMKKAVARHGQPRRGQKVVRDLSPRQ